MTDAESFVANETEQFRALYVWLKGSFADSLFKQIGEESALLVAHSLVGFKLQEYHSQINLADSSIVLSKDSIDATYKIYRAYEERGITSALTYVSTSPLPDDTCFVRITVLSFRPEVDFFWQSLDPAKADSVRLLLDRAKESDYTQCEMVRTTNWTPRSEHSLELLLASGKAPRTQYVGQIFKALLLRNLHLGSFALTFENPLSPERVFVLVANIQGKDGTACWECTDVEKLMQELVSVRDFAQDDLFAETFVRQGYLDGELLIFLRSCSLFVQQLLFHVDSHMYSLDNVQEAFCYWPELAKSLYDLFCLKCDPYALNPRSSDTLQKTLVELIEKQDTGKERADTRRKNVLRLGLTFVDSILKTNFFATKRGAISYRLKATVLKDLSKIFTHMPFGIYYLYQRDFFGFHIRFQDLARGGLRTIAIRAKEAALEEAPLTFWECYQLAWTQQKKNKDIPEGGSKGILFLFPAFEYETHLYRSQRLFIESLLQLANDKEHPEYLYLGPDENMHDVMIEWIADYAKKVGYPPGAAFITSKPKIGINHKRYGVTSLGVNVCMQEVLKYLGINPAKERFTVKMSGGPDGDVAGNQILNFEKHFAKTATLLTLIDVSGVIYDPDGLDLAFLKELFLQAKPIRFYPPEKLSDGGFLLDARSEKKEGVHIVKLLLSRKSGGHVHEEWLAGSEAQSLLRTFVHKTEADVFIPAGGRPATLNATNVHDFLDAAGRPTSKAIIEGANLYLTAQARERLELNGTMIVKDSSANKGGVICSSFEVLASLSLTDEEFLAHKDEIVKQILQKVEQYAKDEVRLILETHRKTHEHCSLISEQISSRINAYSDEIRHFLQPLVLGDDPYMSCFYEYCLPILDKQYHDRLKTNIPDEHKKAIIAAWIASKVVYLRGLDWAPSIVDVLPFLVCDPSITSCNIRR